MNREHSHHREPGSSRFGNSSSNSSDNHVCPSNSGASPTEPSAPERRRVPSRRGFCTIGGNVEVPEGAEENIEVPPSDYNDISACSHFSRSTRPPTRCKGIKAKVCLPGPSTVILVGNDSTASALSPGGGRNNPNLSRDEDLCLHNRATVRERNAAMLFNESMADVWFLVGPGTQGAKPERIPAHMYNLATGSSVFYAMFYGGFPAATNGEIPIPDVEPTAFRRFLKYLYTDEVDLDSDNVLSVLYAAKKYMVPHLTRACIRFLENNLSAKNVCLYLSQSRLFEEHELMQRCWELVDAQAELAMKSEGFLELDFQTLESILSRETLNARETAIFEAALRWAHTECTRQGIDQSSDNKRRVLGAALKLIRVPTMTVEEFANGPAQSGLFSSKETTDIFLHFTAKTKPELPFVSKPRAGLRMQRCHRFQSSAYRSNQWRYRGRCDSIQFSVDRRIFVIGFGLYGSSMGASEYKAVVELKRIGQVLATVQTRYFADGSSAVFPIFFDQPVQIEPDVFYTASALLDGCELSYFGQEGLPEVQAGNVTFQFQCSTESTNGTGVQGGQIPEILFYA